MLRSIRGDKYLSTEFLNYRNENVYICTWNVTVGTELVVKVVMLDLPHAADWSMQTSDCQWLLLTESPTNITFLPFNLIRKSLPLNLQPQTN